MAPTSPPPSQPRLALRHKQAPLSLAHPSHNIASPASFPPSSVLVAGYNDYSTSNLDSSLRFFYATLYPMFPPSAPTEMRLCAFI